MSDALFNAVGLLVADVFGRKGNGCTYSPMKSAPNREPIADPARAEVAGLTLVFSEGAQRVSVANNGLGRSSVGVQASFAGHYIFVSVMAGQLPYAPLKNDEVTDETGKRYRVAEVLPDGLGGCTLRVNEA